MNININDYLAGINIIYWVNLDRSENRRNNMLNMLKNINIPNQRIIAYDGLSNKNIMENFKILSIKGDNIIYATLLSHLNTIKIFSESTHNIALILEDDVTLEFSQYWDKRITEIIDNAPNDWEIIMLSYTVMGHDLIQLYTSNKHGNICCASAYLINKKGAQRLIKNIYKENKYNLENNKFHTADNYIFASMNTYTYKFSYFTHPDNNDSTIHPSHIRFHNQSKKYAKNIWTNKN